MLYNAEKCFSQKGQKSQHPKVIGPANADCNAKQCWAMLKTMLAHAKYDAEQFSVMMSDQRGQKTCNMGKWHQIWQQTGDKKRPVTRAAAAFGRQLKIGERKMKLPYTPS